jgi:imidazole glycerol phosphate synthase subunit HisF
MTLKARIIPCLDVKDCPRRPQPQCGEDVQTQKKATV